MVEIKDWANKTLVVVNAETLRGADLAGTNLAGANLAGADLECATLKGTNLVGANLRSATLKGTNLVGANLRSANLVGANLVGAYLVGADLVGADLSPWAVCPSSGSFHAWKKISGHLIEVQIPADARRTSALVGRKCRADKALVLSITRRRDGASVESVSGGYDPKFVYRVGEMVIPHDYSDDIRIECAPGIHFFVTKEEADAYPR